MFAPGYEYHVFSGLSQSPAEVPPYPACAIDCYTHKSLQDNRPLYFFQQGRSLAVGIRSFNLFPLINPKTLTLIDRRSRCLSGLPEQRIETTFSVVSVLIGSAYVATRARIIA
jgi:hypothetical protein